VTHLRHYRKLLNTQGGGSRDVFGGGDQGDDGRVRGPRSLICVEGGVGSKLELYRINLSAMDTGG
jgi:hypothetical protein